MRKFLDIFFPVWYNVKNGKIMGGKAMNRHDTLLLSGGTAQDRTLLRSVLEGGYNLLEAGNTHQTLLLLQQNQDCIAAVLLDISDPEAKALELMTQEGVEVLWGRIPVIAISGDDSHETLNRAFGFGVSDVIPLDYDSDAMRKRIETIVELSLHKRNLEDMVEEQAEILRHANDTMVDALSSIIEYRSVESGQHILRIRHFTRILLEQVARGCPEYGLTERTIRIISSAAALHDVGKIAIPDSILLKPGKLTPEEWEVMKTHALTGCEILKSLSGMSDPEYLRYAYNICHYHHERWDGGGYPEGLAGEDIPICAQVVGLADVYDALTSRRVYKDAFSFETAINMIFQGECGAFSPKLLECFKWVTDQYESLARAYADGLSPKSEDFDTTLPGPVQREDKDSLEMTRSKYLALVHYVNAFLMEMDLDRGLFHLIYNPYPEMTRFQNISTFRDIETLALNHLVVPRERDRMERFIREDIQSFIRKGRRRAGFRFHFRGKDGPELFEITLLRLNPASERQTLALLCRRMEQNGQPGGSERVILSDSTYVCRFDDQFTLERLSGSTRTLAGYTEEEVKTILGGRLVELIHPEDRAMVLREFRDQLSRGTSVELEHRVCRRDGSVLWVLNKSRLVVEGDGQERIHSFLTDITSTKRGYDALNDKLRRYEIILAQTENVLFEWDIDSDTISYSDTWQSIFGFKPISENAIATIQKGSYFHPDDLPKLMDCFRSLESGSQYEMTEARIVNTAGRYIWCRFRASAVRSETGRLTKIVGIIINIDTEKLAERALQDRAERDSLTKLLNKHAGQSQVEAYLSQYSQNVGCTMLIIDLDNFKPVNDEYGHLFGDAVLAKAAKEIKKLFRLQDIIARVGGDEFMVLMRGVTDRALVESRCAQLLGVFKNVFREQGRKLPLSCSVGIAIAPEHGRTYYELFRRADQALYRAKDQGKNRYAFYEGEEEAHRMPARRISSVNNRIDSDEQPGLADNSIVQYAFQRLYAARDVDAAINDILRLVGELMNVSRVYVFENSSDNRFCSNTYEWCNAGIPSQIGSLQNLSYETDIPDYSENFNERGIFYCPDILVLPRPTRDIVESQGIKSMLHCAIRESGVFRGFIGFDECSAQRLWTKEQIRTLTYFAEMLSVFLLKKRAQEKTTQRANELSSILDNQNAWIYIIDPDTCQLKYLNAKTRALAPQAAEGMPCYRALMGLPERCPGCPARDIRRQKVGSACLQNRKFDLQILAEATLIQWDGEESCLLTCREVPAVQKQP